MSKFTDSVDFELRGIDSVDPGICSGCPDCQSAYGFTDDDEEETSAATFDEKISNGEICDEGGFSWQDCDSCGSSLGGDRFSAHARDKDGNWIHLDICADCLFFHANGDEPEDWQAQPGD